LHFWTKNVQQEENFSTAQNLVGGAAPTPPCHDATGNKDYRGALI